MSSKTFIPTGSANDSLKYVQFTGTDHYYKYMFGIVLTDGAMQLATDEQCFWMMDIVCSYFTHPKINGEEFQVWTLKRQGETDSFKVTCDDGNKNILITQKIPYSDFKFDELKLYKVDNVIMLPSEY